MIRRGRAPATAQVAERPRDGLWSDGLAMSASVGINAVVGLVAWAVSARLMPVAEFGTASAFVSGFILVAGLTGMNLGVALLRWFPAAGAKAATLVWRASLTVAVLSAVVASVYLLLPGAGVLFDAATGSSAPSLAGWGLFVLAAVAWSQFQLHDLVLVGLGRPWWAPAKNVIASAARLTALLVIGAALTAEAVVLAWILPTVVTVVVVSVLVVVLTRRAVDPGVLPARREVLAFLGPTYVGQLASALLYYQVPLLVTFRFGTEVGALFFIAWQVVTVADVVALRFVNALVGQVAREPGAALQLCRLTRRRLLVVFLPGLAAGVALAGPVLSVFGPEYAGATTALQVLLVGAAFRLLVVHALGVRQALGDAVGFARIQLLSTGLVLLGVLVVPAGDGALLLPVALVYLVVQAAFALPLLLPRGPGSAAAVHRRVAARQRSGRHQASATG